MTDHARTHITAMLEPLKEQRPEELAQPAGLFISGMLTGLAASLKILDGSTAEQEMERVEANLASAIGHAYLNGTLTGQPPNPTEELDKINALLQDLGVEGELGAQGVSALANTVRCMREELHHAEMAIARVRLVKKAPSRSPHNLVANAQDDGWDQALDAVHNALGAPERCTTRNAGQDHSVHELLDALRTGMPHSGAVDLIGRYYRSIHEACCPYDHTKPRPGSPAADNRAAPDEQPTLAATEAKEQDAPVDWQAIAAQRERELKTAGEELARLQVIYEETVRRHEGAIARVDELLADVARTAAERDGAYRERAHLVALLAAMTDGAVIAPAPDTEDPGWQIVYLTIGGRQASWHISPTDTPLFACVPHVDPGHPAAQWDGHTTEDKYARIRQHTRLLFCQCGPACTEGHTYTGRCEGTPSDEEADGVQR